ncbi:uncharacterized protein [Physcomitrium patens]|uniref:uncharacterized protein n=1 Tax=Physcomitrium patens TaxID=3218 RepID=UPI003CCD7E7E
MTSTKTTIVQVSYLILVPVVLVTKVLPYDCNRCVTSTNSMSTHIHGNPAKPLSKREGEKPTSVYSKRMKVQRFLLVTFLLLADTLVPTDGHTCRLPMLDKISALSVCVYSFKTLMLFVKVILVYHQLDAESRDHKAKLPKSVGGGGKPL